MGKKYALAVSCGRRLGRDLFSKTTKNNGIRSLHVSVSRKSLRGCSCPVIAVDFDSLKPVIHTTASARTLFFKVLFIHRALDRRNVKTSAVAT